MSSEEFKIRIEVTDVVTNCLRQVKETIDCLTHIYNCVNDSKTNITKPLPTDNLPFKIKDNYPDPTIKEQMQLTIDWALAKSFEDLINGLTKSFKAAITQLRICELYKEHKPTNSKVEFKKNLARIDIDIDIEKYRFPEFIDRIENSLNKQLPLKKEILSINRKYI